MRIKDMIVMNAIHNMADMLMENGFTPKEAYMEAERFWSKHKRKLEGVF